MRALITSPPETAPDGLKRWFIGDLADGAQRVFLFESTKAARAEHHCQRYMLRTFTEEGDLITQRFFDRTFMMNKAICRMFDVDQVELTEEPSDTDTMPCVEGADVDYLLAAAE